MSSILKSNFYHKSIRNYTAIFGSLFNDMKIVREDGKTIKVPLAYSSRQGYDYFEEEKKSPHIKSHYPRMGFVLTSWQRAPERMQNRNFMLKKQNVDMTQLQSTEVQYNRVPYNFFYELYVETKYAEDMFQIMEQISVVFNPSLNVIVKDNEDLDINESIPITLDAYDFQDDYNGSFEDVKDKVIKVTLPFKVEGHLYMPTIQNGVVNTITLNYRDLDTSFLLETDTITE